MTDISVTTTSYQAENRSWLLSQWGQGPGENPSCVLDISTFTEGVHYPNGYLESGTQVAVISETGGVLTVGPWDPDAVDGSEVLKGFLHSAVKVPPSGADPGGALVVCGFVKVSKLPGSVDIADLPTASLFHFTA
ncbi:MAG: K structural protein [Nocardioides sp.]|nr:K structural protein [Nocardioides sp.]MBS45301.1 K structural protein [Nocardioides sp.]